jgi:hypothetical protein
MGVRDNLNKYIYRGESKKYFINKRGKAYLEWYKFFDDGRESIEESMKFERGKSPKKALDIGLKVHICYSCGKPTTEKGENIDPKSEEFKRAEEIAKKNPDKIEPTYCADCYYSDIISDEQLKNQENERWQAENDHQKDIFG